MVSESPPFWWKKPGWESVLLAPVSWIYGAVALRNLEKGRRTPIAAPVICVGNFTVGGAGKTPTVIELAKAARARGLKPGVLSRGYGGTIDKTTIVDPGHHRARDVGDEPLLIAREATTVVSRNRLHGAAALLERGCDIIIMDDGFQSARILFDYALMVVDAKRGIGNGRIIPAGPVRAPTDRQLHYATALLKVGEGTAADPFIRRASRSGKPVMEAVVRPVDPPLPAGTRVLAFAGIADPGKFFDTVRAMGLLLEASRPFGDHQHLTDDEIEEILKTASENDLEIVTTAKDAVRLAGHEGPGRDLARKMRVIDVKMAFDNPSMPAPIIDQAIAGYRKRRLGHPVT